MERVVDQLIREAMDRGEFDNLPGKGKPLNLDEYFNTPEDLRIGFGILKNSGFIPAEVELLSELGTLRKRADTISNDEQKEQLEMEIKAKRLKLDMLMESRRRSDRINRIIK